MVSIQTMNPTTEKQVYIVFISQPNNISRRVYVVVYSQERERVLPLLLLDDLLNGA